jgi:transposase
LPIRCEPLLGQALRKLAQEGSSLSPKKGGGRPPKVDEDATKLLEEDIKECPAITIFDRPRFLELITGKALSDSTVRRLLKRLGLRAEKKGLWRR